MSSGILHWEALCACRLLFERRMPTFNVAFVKKWSRWRSKMHRQVVSKFRLPSELLAESGEVFWQSMSASGHVRTCAAHKLASAISQLRKCQGSLDYMVSSYQDGWRDSEAQCLSGRRHVHRKT